MGLNNKLLYMACQEIVSISYSIAFRPSQPFFWLILLC
jgi:hypothetical protein